MANIAKDNVLQLVPKLSELQLLEVCTGEGLQLTKSKKDRKTALANMLVRYVTSEDVEDSDDEGLALYTKLTATMKALIDEDDDNETTMQEKLEQEMQDKLSALKSTVQQYSLETIGDGQGSSSSGDGGGLGGLGGLAFDDKSPEFESLIDRIVMERLKSGPLADLVKTEDGQGVVLDNTKTKMSPGLSSSTDQLSSSLVASGADNAANQSSSEGGSSKSSTGDGVTSQFHKLKLREFKIANGTVGGDGSLDYSDLVMQIKEGITLGYAEKEVMSGVIRATKPGSELRRYLVRHSAMTFDDFKSTLREFYNVKESQQIMDEMRDLKRQPGQLLIKYVMSMCALRGEIYEVSKTEECPPMPAQVEKRFEECCLSGIKDPTLRLQMEMVLKQKLPDPKLFKEVNKIAARYLECEKKFEAEDAKTADVKATDVGGKKRAKSRDDEWREEHAMKMAALTAQVSKLEALINRVATGDVNLIPQPEKTMEEKMATLLGQVHQLTTQMQQLGNSNRSGNGGDGYGGQKKTYFKFQKCDECVKNNQYCNHCRKCGKVGHKKVDCPEN